MNELIANLHMHTTYSDGHGTHASIAQAALKAGLDIIITTDHNIYINGLDQYFQEGERKLFLMIGEEVHDVLRDPQKIIFWFTARPKNCALLRVNLRI